MTIAEFEFANLNAEMYDLMETLKGINRTLPFPQQLPEVLFLTLTWAIYEWRQMMASSAGGDTDEKLEWLEWWREKSGYNDLRFITDRFAPYLSQEQKKVISTFEAWGSEQHYFEYLAEIPAGIITVHVAERWDKAAETVTLKPNYCLKVELSAPGDFQWRLMNGNLLLLKASETTVSVVNKILPPPGGIYEWRFWFQMRSDAVGEETLRFLLTDCREKTEKTARTFTLTVETQEI